LLGDDLTHGIHECGDAAASLACGEHGVHDTRLDAYLHLGGCDSSRHANTALRVFTPVALVVGLDEFALGDAFDIGLLGVEVLQRVGSAVGFPEDQVVEVHIAGKLCALEHDAKTVHLGGVFNSELVFAVAEFNLVVLECSEVRHVTERNLLPFPTTTHVEYCDVCPAVFVATIAGFVQAWSCRFACDAQVEGNGNVLAPVGGCVDVDSACFCGIGLDRLETDVEGHVSIKNGRVLLDGGVNGVTRKSCLAVSFTHGVQCFYVGDVADFATELLGLTADDGEVAVAFVAGVPHAGDETVFLSGCDRVAVPSGACFEVLLEVVAREFVETFDGTHFANHDRDAFVVEAGLESAEKIVDGSLGAESGTGAGVCGVVARSLVFPVVELIHGSPIVLSVSICF